MHVAQTRSFKRSLKKIHSNEKQKLDAAVKAIISNPLSGEEKKGDLQFVRVYKFKMCKTLTLLAYTWEEDLHLITLLKLSTHENFYRDLKKERL